MHKVLFILYPPPFVRKKLQKKQRPTKDCRHCSMEENPLRVKRKRDWGRGFIFLLSQLLYCVGQVLVVIVLSQHQVLSSRTVGPRAPCGAWCKLWAALLRYGLQFVQWRYTRNPVKERDHICAWTNKIAQHQSADN